MLNRSGRMYDLVAFDMDGVLVRYPSSWTWVHHHFGVENDTALEAYIRGEIDDSEFMRRDIALWIERKRDLCAADIDSILEKLPITNGVRETVESLRDADIRTVIVSGGLDSAARRISEEYGFDGWLANGLECDREGRLTGAGVLRVELMNKRRALDFFQSRWGVEKERSVCVGNSFVDISMFERCGLGIAYNPIDDLVAKKADVVVVDPDLRSVLPHILGVREPETKGRE